MFHFKKRTMGIGFIVGLLTIAVSMVAFAQATGMKKGEAAKNIKNCGNSWTRIWNGDVTLDGVSDGSYPVTLVGGNFEVVKNVVQHGCQIEVVLNVASAASVYQCTAATASQLGFACGYSGSEMGSDASGLSTVFNPVIAIGENVEGEAGFTLSTLGSSAAGEGATFGPATFSGRGGVAQIVILTKK